MKLRLQLLLLFFTLSCYAHAQSGQGGNRGGGVDDESFHFGFTFQYVASEYKILKLPDWQKAKAKEVGFMEPLQSISSTPSPGFGLGFVTNVRLGDNADLRFTPALVFSDRVLTYTYPTEQAVKKEIPSTVVDIPLGIKLKSDRRLNFRAYLIAGGKYSMDIISKKKTDDSNLAAESRMVKNRKSILSYEAGIGFDFYFEYFKLSPEIKLSNSINSVLNTKEKPNPYTSPLERLYNRTFQFSLYFE